MVCPARSLWLPPPPQHHFLDDICKESADYSVSTSAVQRWPEIWEIWMLPERVANCVLSAGTATGKKGWVHFLKKKKADFFRRIWKRMIKHLLTQLTWCAFINWCLAAFFFFLIIHHLDAFLITSLLKSQVLICAQTQVSSAQRGLSKCDWIKVISIAAEQWVEHQPMESDYS